MNVRGYRRAAKMGTGWHTILMVDSDPAVLDSCARALRNHGYAVLTANKPEEALGISREHKSEIDLLIIDVMMPGLDGCTLAVKISVQRPKMRIIFTAAFDDGRVHRFNTAMGMNSPLLLKPFFPKALLDTIAQPDSG